MSRKPNHSLSPRSAKYDNESAPYFSTMKRARSRESGRYDERRGETAGRNSSQQNDSAIAIPTASSAGDTSRSVVCGSAIVFSPTSRSVTASMTSGSAIAGCRNATPIVPPTTATTIATNDDTIARRHDDGFAGAAKSSRWTTRNATTMRAMIASSMSRPLVTLPITATSRSPFASSHA